MKMNRLIKRKNLFALLFAVLLALPMCAILGRVLYTQWNKNAKDSYSDSYIQSNQEVTNATLLIPNQTYILTWQQSSYGNYNDPIYFYNSISVDWTDYGANNQYEYVAFMMNTYHTPSRIRLYYYDNNSALQNIEIYAWAKNSLNTIVFNLQSVTNANNFKEDKTQRNYLMYLENIKIDSLDNAFEYSVNQFINDNNFGKLDFFQWFDNMFLDSNNSVNNMYVHFVNWYLNYALLISLAYILFLVLMWFINYVRKLLERGMDFGEGSY